MRSNALVYEAEELAMSVNASVSLSFSEFPKSVKANELY